MKNFLFVLPLLLMYSCYPPAFADDHTDRAAQETCLAKNIYWEARNQPLRGMIAVALVTRNRVNDWRYPDNYCAVVEQGPTRPSWKDNTVLIPVRHRCQFSWFCDGKSDVVPNIDKEVWSIARIIAMKVINTHSGYFPDFTDGATHYHATYVYPEWAETKTKTRQIGDHVFYRWEMP